MARFYPQGQFYLDHFHRIQSGLVGKSTGIELTVGGAVTEISRANLPDDVASELLVITAEPVFAGSCASAVQRGRSTLILVRLRSGFGHGKDKTDGP